MASPSFQHHFIYLISALLPRSRTCFPNFSPKFIHRKCVQ